MPGASEYDVAIANSPDDTAILEDEEGLGLRFKRKRIAATSPMRMTPLTTPIAISVMSTPPEAPVGWIPRK